MGINLVKRWVFQVNHNFRNKNGHEPSFSSAPEPTKRGVYSGKNLQNINARLTQS